MRFISSGLNPLLMGILSVSASHVSGNITPPVVSSNTDPVFGRAPVVNDLLFDKNKVFSGDTLTISYSFSDPDRDDELGTTIRWYRDGVLVSDKNETSYVVNEANGDRVNAIITAVVTPRTNEWLTEPNSGASNEISIAVLGKPSVSNLDVEGTLQRGSTLKGRYEFTDLTKDSNDASIVKWTNGGRYYYSSEYELDSGDVGKVITYTVEAKNSFGVMGNSVSVVTGDPALSVTGGSEIQGEEGQVIDPKAAPEVSDLEIAGPVDGVPAVGKELVGSYNYNAMGSGSNDDSRVSWSAGPSGVVGTGKIYEVLDSDLGKVIYFKVEARNKIGTTGNQLSVQTRSSVINTGRKPSIKKLVFDNQPNAIGYSQGRSLVASYTFDSNMGNGTDESIYFWGFSGQDTEQSVGSSTLVVPGTGSVSRVLTRDDIGKVAKLSIKARNGLGLFGDAVATIQATRSVSNIGVFSSPPNNLYTWDEANGFCNGLTNNSYRLATEVELVNVFKTATSGVSPNDDMFDLYQWPLTTALGGAATPDPFITDWHWTGDTAGGNYRMVNMQRNQAADGRPSDKRYAACVLRNQP